MKTIKKTEKMDRPSNKTNIGKLMWNKEFKVSIRHWNKRVMCSDK